MENQPPPQEGSAREELDSTTRFFHLGLTLFGVLAWLAGFFAGDYKRYHHPGFDVHRWLGLGLSCFMLCRLWYGFYGPKAAQFKEWVPYTPERLRRVGEDLLSLLTLKLPDRPPHQGLSGVVQTFGLAVFGWMALTGSLMFFFLTPGRKAGGLLHLVKEMHEAAVWLVAAFLAVHGGAVLLHALSGDHLWRRTFFLDREGW